MAPLGPPPYTMEQITAMTSKADRARARAELESYIARIKREKQEREMKQIAASGGYPTFSSNSGPSSRRVHTDDVHRAHPYQRSRSQYMHPKFKHRSMTFGNVNCGAECSTASEAVTAPPRRINDTALGQEMLWQVKANTLCPALTSTGVCSRHGCRHLHDPTKLALCKRWLYKGDCPKGDFCDLAHESTAYNAPTCLHFQDGGCNNEDCHFAHVRISPAAVNCNQFGRLGYCEKGSLCAERHAHECPSFANTGTCSSGDRCRLGHVHRASRMRTVKWCVADDCSMSKTSEEGSGTAEDKQKAAATTQSQSVSDFTQQDDYVPLDVGE